jgi:hypothetical protein
MDDKAKIKDKDRVYKIISDAYKTGDPNNYPTQYVISKKVREVKNREIDPNWEEKKYSNKPGFYGNCQSSVSKCLKVLIKEEKILKLEGNVYVPYEHDFSRKFTKEKIIKMIVFNRRTVFTLSSNREKRKDKDGEEYIYATCSLLVDVSFDYIVTAKELFRKYIGTENCYDIMEFQGKVLIMIEGVEKEVATLRRNIREIVEETYDKNNK